MGPVSEPSSPSSSDSAGNPQQPLTVGQTFTRDGVTYKVVKRRGRRPKGEPPPAGPRSQELGEVAVARHRQAPRFGAFLAMGALCGALTAAICVGGGSGDTGAGPVVTFAWFALVTVPIGIALGGAVAYGLDVRSRRMSERLVPGQAVVGGQVGHGCGGDATGEVGQVQAGGDVEGVGDVGG